MKNGLVGVWETLADQSPDAPLYDNGKPLGVKAERGAVCSRKRWQRCRGQRLGGFGLAETLGHRAKF
eukprot:scaffold110_cov285-Alexandrium_tamarense.AAC.6